MTLRSPEPPGDLGPAVELPVREEPPGLREALPVPSLLLPFLPPPSLILPALPAPALPAFCSPARGGGIGARWVP